MKSDVLVVGGGISGLSMAFYAAQAGYKTTLLEKRERVGGSFNSHTFAENGREFWLEMGAHTCYSSYQNLLDIVEACNLMDAITPREKVPFSLLIDNQVKSLMSALNLFEALKSAPSMFSLKKDGLTVREYYSKIAGKGNYEKTLRHFFNAVPSQPTDDFPADMMFKSREKRKDVLKNYTFKGGLQSVAKAIAKSKGINVFTSQDVKTVTLQDGIYTVTTSEGSSFTAGTLALALPSAAGASLLKEVDPAIAAHLGKLKAASVDSVGVVIRKEDIALKPVAALISPEDIFFSAVSRDVVPDDHYRGFAFHFKPGLDDERKMSRITEALGITTSKIAHIYSTINIVPSLRLGHDKWLKEMDSLLQGRKLLLGGNYFGGMAIEDCVSRSRSETRRLVK